MAPLHKHQMVNGRCKVCTMSQRSLNEYLAEGRVPSCAAWQASIDDVARQVREHGDSKEPFEVQIKDPLTLEN